MPLSQSEKHANFQRLAESRLSGVLEGLRKLSNLSSSNYEFEEDEVHKLFNTIEERLADVRGRFLLRFRGKKRP
jgi:hypothetical protein